MKERSVYIFLCFVLYLCMTEGWNDVWQDVQCDEEYSPKNCDFDKIPLVTVEDFERCAPGELPLFVRNYYLGWSGRGFSYRENREAFGRIHIKPKILRNTSDSSLEITTLGQKVAFPVGISPTALHKLADPEAENATVSAAAAMNTIMILSSYATTSIEEVAEKVRGTPSVLWMQLYVLTNRSYTVNLVRRAEKSDYKALVLTVDSSLKPAMFCDAKNHPGIANVQLANFPVLSSDLRPAVVTFNDIRWLKSITKLPIVAKGILTGDDAQKAIEAGASAILVSNHGGRQLDGVPGTIDALSDVVDRVSKMYPRRDVYLDGGVRNGLDVYKALARGAKMVFIGRPVLWGLTLGGEEGVKKVLNIIKTDFFDVMRLAGSSNPSKIHSKSIFPSLPTCD